MALGTGVFEEILIAMTLLSVGGLIGIGTLRTTKHMLLVLRLTRPVSGESA